MESTWTLADLKKSVTQAEARNNGGWVQLTFHHICRVDDHLPGAGRQPDDLQPVRRLAGSPGVRRHSGEDGRCGHRRDHQAGGCGPVAPEAAPGVNAIKNPSMETFNSATGLPQCYLAGGYGTNTADLRDDDDGAHREQTAVKIDGLQLRRR